MSRRARPTVLLVEHDPPVAQLLAELFETRRYGVSRAASGTEAEQLLGWARPDVVIVDLLAPDLNRPGLFAGPRRIPYIPIIVLGADRQREHRILGLRVDAQGFVVWPCNVDELAERVAEMLRSKGRSEPAKLRVRDRLRVGRLLVDCEHRRVSVGGQSLRLTPTEYWLLLALVRHPGQVVSRDELAREMPEQRAATGQALTTHMARLRAKLACGGPGVPEIKAVRGHGYMLVRVPAALAGAKEPAERA